MVVMQCGYGDCILTATACMLVASPLCISATAFLSAAAVYRFSAIVFAKH